MVEARKAGLIDETPNPNPKPKPKPKPNSSQNGFSWPWIEKASVGPHVEMCPKSAPACLPSEKGGTAQPASWACRPPAYTPRATLTLSLTLILALTLATGEHQPARDLEQHAVAVPVGPHVHTKRPSPW